MWIFGYGSLIWRPDFEFDESAVVALSGWRRSFSQGSPDHRGTPSAPGRVVTLREDPGGGCWGVAYRVPLGRSGAILQRLDEREQGGYDRVAITVHREPGDGSPWAAVTYVAPVGNPHDLGPATLDAMVAQMASACGPSGPNREYVLRLREALDERGIPDPIVTEIAQALVERTSS